MSLYNVRRIMECDGELTSEFSFDYVPYRTYSWSGRNWPSAAIITFHGSMVESMTQIGLR